MLLSKAGTSGKQTVMTKGGVENRDVCWGPKEENHFTSSSSLVYCKTNFILILSIVEHLNINNHHNNYEEKNCIIRTRGSILPVIIIYTKIEMTIKMINIPKHPIANSLVNWFIEYLMNSRNMRNHLDIG